MTPEELGILLGLTGRNTGQALGQAVGDIGFPAIPMIPARDVMGGVEQFGRGFMSGLGGQPSTSTPGPPQAGVMPSGAFSQGPGSEGARLAAIQAQVNARNKPPTQHSRVTTPAVDPTPARGSLRYSRTATLDNPNVGWQDYTPNPNANVSMMQGSDEQQKQMQLNSLTADTAIASKRQELASARMSPYEKAQVIAASRAKQGDPIKQQIANQGMSMIQDPSFGQSLARERAKEEWEKAKPGQPIPPGYLEEASKRVDQAQILKLLMALAQSLYRGGPENLDAVPQGYNPGQ